MNKDNSFRTLDKKILIACLAGVILFAIYQFYPQLNQAITLGAMMTLRSSMWTFAVVPWIVAGLLCVAIAIIYWLAGIRNNILAATFGFSISYLAVSLLTVILEMTRFVEIILGIILAYIIFMGALWLTSKFRLQKIPSIAIGAVALGLLLYLTPILTHPIEARRATAKINSTFKQTVQQLNFTSYYPSYKSTALPTTYPLLNGYADTIYLSETIDFFLGKAWVRQSQLLEGQSKIMDFTNNCDILAVWSSMGNGTTINAATIENSRNNPKMCNLIQITPSGKNVYLLEVGNSAFIYTQIDGTNIVIVFDEFYHNKYDPTQLPEILKIIDSLEPLDKSRLKMGEELTFSFGSHSPAEYSTN